MRIKKLSKLLLVGAIVGWTVGAGVASAAESFPVSVTAMKHVQKVPMTKQWDKVFPQNPNVAHQKVEFKNRYGITLVGDLYVPKDLKTGVKMPAIAISGPFGAVKEQSSGLYAQELASRGFVTIAFDPSNSGESVNVVKNVASPELYTEDFSAAVDFLGLQPFVNREAIGILGICGLGGFALNDAAMDTRVKAVVASTMYDMPRVITQNYNDSDGPEQRQKKLQALNEQRWRDAESGIAASGPRLNPDLKGGEPQFVREYYDYYRTKRGYHPRSVNSSGAFTATTLLPFLNTHIMEYIDRISPRPVLIIVGEKAHSRYMSETAFKALGNNPNKELVIVPNAVHTDLYDNMEKIPFAKIADFFHKNL